MSEKKISYLSRTYEDYKQDLIDFTRTYYPDIASNLSDASIGSWLIDLVSVVGDNLSFYIDAAYNETNLESAVKASSVYALARSNGFKIPGPKGSITEVEFSCVLPNSSSVPNSSSSLGMPNFTFAPIIKQGTRLRAANGQYFETDETVDFSEQFNNLGESNRNITPLVDSNNNVEDTGLLKLVRQPQVLVRYLKWLLSSNQI